VVANGGCSEQEIHGLGGNAKAAKVFAAANNAESHFLIVVDFLIFCGCEIVRFCCVSSKFVSTSSGSFRPVSKFSDEKCPLKTTHDWGPHHEESRRHSFFNILVKNIEEDDSFCSEM